MCSKISGRDTLSVLLANLLVDGALGGRFLAANHGGVVSMFRGRGGLLVAAIGSSSSECCDNDKPSGEGGRVGAQPKLFLGGGGGGGEATEGSTAVSKHWLAGARHSCWRYATR